MARQSVKLVEDEGKANEDRVELIEQLEEIETAICDIWGSIQWTGEAMMSGTEGGACSIVVAARALHEQLNALDDLICRLKGSN